MDIDAGSSSINSTRSASHRLSKVKVSKEGQAAAVSYLHNAMGQRVFKSEPKADRYQPSEEQLGTDFVTWLKKNFSWMFAKAQTDASIGTAYSYADGQLPEWAVLGEYDNGSAKGAGRTKYIWLPTDDQGAIPVGIYRNGKFFAIHTDHSGTPRLMTNEQNVPVWQWPYTAFGNNKPTGVLKATPNPRAAMTNTPVLLRATAATEMNLRFPGQYADEEAGQFYNYFRNYQPNQGRYTQNDPIGLAGGLNRYAYVDGSPLIYSDPDDFKPRSGSRNNGGNSSQRREADRAEANRIDSYFQRQAERDAFISSFTRTNREWDKYGDGIGSMTGAGGRFHHPSVPNSLEWLISPDRINSGQPYVPSLPVPICERSSIR